MLFLIMLAALLGMASSVITLRSSNTCCHGCGKASAVQARTGWECPYCGYVNHLDQNGEIADPPATTEANDYDSEATPVWRPYAVPRPTSPSTQFIFCTKCQRNQHLYVTSLRQFHISLDPFASDYRNNDVKLARYMVTLEKAYPQCCSSCEPGALAAMNKSRKIAQADFLSRALERTRVLQDISISPATYYLGDLLSLFWYSALYAQLMLNAIGLLQPFSRYINPYLSATLHDVLPFSLSTTINTVLSTYLVPLLHDFTSQAWLVPILSLASFVWSPKFTQPSMGFKTHAKGLRNWYRFQCFTSATRWFTWFILDGSILAKYSAGAVLVAHVVSFGVNLLLLNLAYNSLATKVAPLFASPYRKIGRVAPPGAENTLMAALEDIDIDTTPTQESFKLSSHLRNDSPIPFPVTPRKYRYDPMDVDTPPRSLRTPQQFSFRQPVFFAEPRDVETEILANALGDCTIVDNEEEAGKCTMS